jgi:hypothetical protein
VPVHALTLLAQSGNHDHTLSLESLFSGYRAAFVTVAVGGFIVAVIGHLIQSKVTVVTGILLVFITLLIFPIVLYVRGMP